jgi:hypothetical protein
LFAVFLTEILFIHIGKNGLTVNSTKLCFRLLLLSWSVCAIENNASTIKWPSPIAKNREIIHIFEEKKLVGLTQTNRKFSGQNGLFICKFKIRGPNTYLS